MTTASTATGGDVLDIDFDKQYYLITYGSDAVYDGWSRLECSLWSSLEVDVIRKKCKMR